MMFYCGGHIGDVIYTLYTIMKAGGGGLVLGPGQLEMWGNKQIRALIPLCLYQSYIRTCRGTTERVCVDHDFTIVNDFRNQDEFFEWDERVWPGNCHLKKRYFNSYFRRTDNLAQQLTNYNEEPWLDAPSNGLVYDIIFHAPHRKLAGRYSKHWLKILEKLSENWTILVIGGDDDIDEWPDKPFYTKMVPSDFLVVATYIKAASLFLGLASCNYVIAEGLDKFRFVDMAPQTEGAEPANQRGWDITRWSDERVIDAVELILR